MLGCYIRFFALRNWKKSRYASARVLRPQEFAAILDFRNAKQNVPESAPRCSVPLVVFLYISKYPGFKSWNMPWSVPVEEPSCSSVSCNLNCLGSPSVQTHAVSELLLSPYSSESPHGKCVWTEMEGYMARCFTDVMVFRTKRKWFWWYIKRFNAVPLEKQSFWICSS